MFEVYVPTDRLEECSGMKRSDAHFKEEVEDILLDYVEDRTYFKICISRRMRQNPTDGTQEEFLVLQSMHADT